MAKIQSTPVLVTHDEDETVLLTEKILMKRNGLTATFGEVLYVELKRYRTHAQLDETQP
ncbi:hypothetical protein [Polaromonas vacuolata]|uniref:hypothetical protein n=1 Tax=Polaromonas vacuolata TaxID=37448 RepID=UPI0014566180|nr:hypothetical protein [Polaromonas vacuolata]